MTHVQIRDVPDDVRARLATHASENGQSMQVFLRQVLDAVASRPTRKDWDRVARLRARASLSGEQIDRALQDGRLERDRAADELLP